MRLVHIQPIYAELFKGDDIILAILGAQLFQLELQLLSGFFQLLDGKALAVVAFQFLDALHDFGNLILKQLFLTLMRDRDFLKLAVPDDHRIIIAGRNSRTEFFPVAGFKILFRRNQNVGGRVKTQELGSPLLRQVIGHDEHAFLAQAKPLAFHGSRHHLERLARAHLMGKQRVAAVQDMCDSVPLVLPQRNLRVHAGENDVAAVVFARTNGVEQFIILRHQRPPPLWVLPDPFAEGILDRLLLLLCKGGCFLVEHALLFSVRILHSVVDAHIPQVQRILQNLVGVGPVRTVGGIRGDIGARHDVLAVDSPFGGMGREVYLDGTVLVIRGIQQLVHEVLNVLRRNPRRTQPHVNVGCLQILGLCRFQRRHIGLKGSVRLRSGLSFAQLLPHIAGQVFIRRRILRLGAGDSEDDAGQLLNDVLLAFPGQLGHIAEVNPGALPDGHRQRVGRGVHMIDAALLLDRPPGEHIRFPQQLVIIIEDFERAEQVVGGIRRKHKAVGPVIDEAEARREAVIQSIQLLLKLLNLPVAVLIELCVDQLANLIPQGNHALDALLRCLIQVGLHHAAVLAVIDGAVDHSIREVAHIGIGGNGLVDRFIVAQIG